MEKIRYWGIVLLLMITVCGCESKWPQNGKMDGQWQLMSITDRNTQEKENVKEKKLFYRFQLELLMVTDLGGSGYGTYIGRFDYEKGDSEFTIKEMNVRNNVGDSGIAATEEQLKPFGLQGPGRVEIVTLKRKEMVLRTEKTEMEFRKF